MREARSAGATILCHDPLVSEWPELDVPVLKDLPEPDGVDLVLFAVPHRDYLALDLSTWLNGSRPAVLDANDVLTRDQRRYLRERGFAVGAIGRGFGEE